MTFKVTVVGRNHADLLMLTNPHTDKLHIQHSNVGSRLLFEFLEGDKYLRKNRSVFEFRNIGHRGSAKLLSSVVNLRDEKDKVVVSSHHSVDVINDEIISGFDINYPTNTPSSSEVSKVSKQVLVIDDPTGDLLDFQEQRVLLCPERSKPLTVIYQTKCQDRLPSSLKDALQKHYLEKFVVIIDVNDLRDTGIQVSRNLSWEKAAADTVENFMRNGEKTEFSEEVLKKLEWVIRFGYGGAIVTRKNSKNDNHLYYDPQNGERRIVQQEYVHSAALEAAFLSGLVSGMIYPLKKGSTKLGPAIERGLSYSRYLASIGLNFSGEGSTRMLKYPKLKVIRNFELQHSIIPVNDTDKWSILTWTVDDTGKAQQKKKADIIKLGALIVEKGPQFALANFPTVNFGKLVTADRSQTEKFSVLSNAVEDYLESKENKPFSIGVFGAPGSGKSFVIEQVIEGITRKIASKDSGKFPTSTWNLSQLLDYSSLLVAFQTVRDAVVKGLVPIVFFDEFDTTLNGELGWLKYFLAPMQDGKFNDHGYSRPIGKAIFIFIGGTAHTYAEFENVKIRLTSAGSATIIAPQPSLKSSRSRSEGSAASIGNEPPQWNRFVHEWRGQQEDMEEKAAKTVKKPDFVSRLGPHLDIQGYNETSDGDLTFIIRRATLLHSVLGENLELEDNLIYGFLSVAEFKHGARSIESIIKNSAVQRGKITRSKLPPNDQLSSHVDVSEFFKRVEEFS